MQILLLEKVPATDPTFIGQDCKTLSRIREKPIPGQPSSSRPLRSEACVKGSPGLSEANQQRVDNANALVAFTCLLVRRVVRCRNGFGLERPRNSFLWQLIPMMDDVFWRKTSTRIPTMRLVRQQVRGGNCRPSGTTLRSSSAWRAIVIIHMIKMNGILKRW